MAKDRIAVCENYVAYNLPCKKGKIAKHNSVCQKCYKYAPRAKVKKFNKKKAKLQKNTNKEFQNYSE